MKTRQKGMALEVTIIAAALFFSLAAVALKFKQDRVISAKYESEAYAISIVQSALQRYSAANKLNFTTGKEVMYVVDQYAPTITELRNLGFLSTNAESVSNPFGNAYATTLTVMGTGAVEGMVYLTGNIRDANGNPDQPHACAIARALGEAGICSSPNDPTRIGNSTTQRTNATGLPAIVGALIFVSA
jgi:hypothetical protein